MSRLLPDRAIYRTGEEIRVEVGGTGGPGALRIRHLGETVRVVELAGDGTVTIGCLPEGGYGVELVVAGATACRTAVDVHADPRSRLRYGFVADFAPDRETAGVCATVRGLHLNGMLFYDWAFRHADLLGGGQRYEDALGQPVSLDTVRDLVRGVQQAGAEALGYAAVYGVGAAEWPTWEHRALLDAEGRVHSLGDFLRLVDPAAPDWSAHLAAELAQAVRSIGFDGFHLDQYGSPRVAVDVDGTLVDLAESFARLIGTVRHALPGSRLVFNNVNDFPTWRTARAPQDAAYIEVWPPQVTFASLAAVVTRARASIGAKPVVVAAYPSEYRHDPGTSSDAALALTMATLFSHGAWLLVAGEVDRILVDPYYVRNHRATPATASLLHRWFDFAVEHDELLFDPDAVDVTASYAGTYNDECDVSAEPSGSTSSPTGDGPGTADRAVPILDTPVPGTVWRRIVRGSDGALVIHLINLIDQGDILWEAPHLPATTRPRLWLRLRRTGSDLPRVRVAGPDGTPYLTPVPVRADGTHAIAELPPLPAWLVVLVDPPQPGTPAVPSGG